jgi:hypothetical protein
MESWNKPSVSVVCDRTTERLRAQARLLHKIAGECWNEETAGEIEKFAHECTDESASAEPQNKLIRAKWPQR